MSYAPIAIFVYKRPDHVKQVIESLKKNPESIDSDLYIFSDAAKDQDSENNVKLVRNYLSSINGFKSIKIIERKKNFGLAKSIITGVTDVINRYGKIIVLEDDLIVSPHFLQYMNAALQRYQNEDKVMQISGYMFPISVRSDADAIFLPFVTSWGWATWERSWRYFDPMMKSRSILESDKKIRQRFDLDGSYGYNKMLELQVIGKIDSWAIQWYLSVFAKGGLTLYPSRTLVDNIGFDGSGTHCRGRGPQKLLPKDFHVIIYPKKIAVSNSFVDIKDYLRNENRENLHLYIGAIKRVKDLLELACHSIFSIFVN